MKKLFVLVALVIAAQVQAATTYTLTTPSFLSNIRGPRAQAICTTGTEANALSATDGLPLYGITGFTVYAKSGSAFTAGGRLLAYMRNPVDGVWSYVADGSMDLVLAAVTSQAFAGFIVVDGHHDRIAYLPSGAGGSNPITIDIVGHVK